MISMCLPYAVAVVLTKCLDKLDGPAVLVVQLRAHPLTYLQRGGRTVLQE